MKLKEIFKVVFPIVMVVFILSISMGVNISKMKCDENGSVYLGSEVPSCSVENVEKVTCCMIEVGKSCCPEMNDNTCASETQNIHFDFETLLTAFELDFSSVNSLLYTLIPYDKASDFTKVINYFSGMPPPKLHKPVLAKIQSFLL